MGNVNRLQSGFVKKIVYTNDKKILKIPIPLSNELGNLEKKKPCFA